MKNQKKKWLVRNILKIFVQVKRAGEVINKNRLKEYQTVLVLIE